MKPSREEVLQMAKDSGINFFEGLDSVLWFMDDPVEDSLERFAAAMYEAGAAKGAEDMRARAAKECDARAMRCDEQAQAHVGLDDDEATTLRSLAWQFSVLASAIRSLPITPTNTEGEQG